MSFGDKVSHKAQELRGRVKRNAGEVTNNPRLRAEGRSEEIGGHLKQAVDKVKDAFGMNRRRPRRDPYRDTY
jgi:uncharacterized protein YjbJ (UPF0337 family)